MAKKTRWDPVLGPIAFLLQGRPGELLDMAVGEQPESDRAMWTRFARGWVGREVLTPAERDRIQAVWLDDEPRPALNVSGDRLRELNALTAATSSRPEPRPNAEQLRAGMGS